MTASRWVLLALATLLGLAALSAWIYRDIPLETLEARYGNSASHYPLIDGVRMHYRDEGEGEGPAIVLVHGQFASLLMWDPWVEALQDRYRVVRFDLPGHGLSDADPSGDYSHERTLALTEKLIDALGLERFSIGGSGMGATVAFHYAARYPERVERLVLASPETHGSNRSAADAARVPSWMTLLRYVTPRALIRRQLENEFADDSLVNHELVTQWHELLLGKNHREAALARLRQQAPLDAEPLAKIRAPVLVMWGEKNATDTVPAPDFKQLCPNSPDVRVLTYPGVGSQPVLEAPERTKQDVSSYLDAPVPTLLAPAS
jgi:pimeloyl-ACP methyl ester carboxylesterase